MGKKALVKMEEGVTASSVAHGCAALLDAGLADVLGPAGREEEGLASGGRLAVRVAQRMLRLKHNLELSQEALARIRDELRPWRLRRDAACDALYAQARDMRRFCRAAFGEREGDAFLGLHGSLPREPKELHSAFGPVMRRLADPGWSLPDVVLEGFSLDREKAAKSALDHYRDLDTALAAVKSGETREAVAQAAKKRAETVHNAFLGKGTRFLVAALELAGLDDLAGTLKPGANRPGRPAKKALAEIAATEDPALLAAASEPVAGQLEAGDGDDEPTGKAK